MFLLVGVAGCATEEADAPDQTDPPATHASVLEKADIEKPADEEAKAKRAWTQRHEPVVQPVDWVEASKETLFEVSRLPEAERSDRKSVV